MKPIYKSLIFFFAIIISFNFIIDVKNMVSLSSTDDTNPSCEQISQNEFMVHSDDSQGCLLWGYINFEGKLVIDVKKFETDTKVYYWWTTGQFLIKSDIKELDVKNEILIPKSRRVRLHVRTEYGSAHITLNEIIFKK
ncbi:hypothetical protein N9L92_02125 [Saprospiraceae bacterium]|nr:hypothetical protein [Saprospiraceae bacterium]